MQNSYAHTVNKHCPDNIYGGVPEKFSLHSQEHLNVAGLMLVMVT